MGTDNIKKYGDLEQELENAKHTLVVLNDNIRRIIGRSPKDLSRNDKYKGSYDSKRTDGDGDRRGAKIGDPSKFKRRLNNTKSVFSRLSNRPGGNDEVKPRLTSRVIRELPTRQEIVAAQGTDSESRARNRRMFGSLLGTLHKFCQEETRLKQKEDKKAQVEKKVEEQERKERQTLKRERELLFMDRKRKQLEVRKLELKMNRLKDFEIWEKAMLPLRHHLRTKTKPYIYFKPRVMSKKTEKLLSEHQKIVDDILDKGRDALKKDIAEIEDRLKFTDLESEEYSESFDVSIATDEFCKNVETHFKDDSYTKKNKEKGDIDLKENKSKHLGEPLICSSVVVVPKSEPGEEIE